MNLRGAHGRGTLPLIVGVTGHRDLAGDEVPEIARQVRELFAMLRERCPHTPIVLLSSLADGADRLVAHTALGCGAELYAVLPLQVNLYEQDFHSAESLAEFRYLLGRSYGRIVVARSGERNPQAAWVPGPSRDHRYAAAGAFIVTYSQVLIALWDGRSDEMLGGTSQIVRFALQGVPAGYLNASSEPLRTSETGAVYHVRVSRRSGPESGLPNSANWLYPGDNGPDEEAKPGDVAFEENLRSLEHFNRDAMNPSIEKQARASAASLLPSVAPTLAALKGAPFEYTRLLFGQADALALQCRNLTHAAMIAIFVIVGVAAVSLALYAEVFRSTPALFFVFLALVALAVALDRAVARSRLQDRFQDYRALAEGLRVEFYWRLAGIGDSVYDHYLARQEGELEWIRDAMHAARFRRQREPDWRATDELQTILEAILAKWINGEEAYFFQAARLESEMAARIKLGLTVCLSASGLISAILAVTLILHVNAGHELLLMLLTLTLAGAALFTGYGQKRAHEEHARRYQRMVVLYRVAGERVADVLRRKDLGSARGVLVELGREALAETCDWLLLHRERRIEVPTA